MNRRFARTFDAPIKGVGGLEDSNTKLGAGIAILGVSALIYGSVVSSMALIGTGVVVVGAGAYYIMRPKDEA